MTDLDAIETESETVRLLCAAVRDRDTEIARLKAPAAVWEERLGAAHAEIARLRAPPGADAMGRAKLIARRSIGPYVGGYEEQVDRVAYDINAALQQYGDERARETAGEWLRAAEISKATAVREAREATIEEAVQSALAYRDEADSGKHPDLGDPQHSLGQGYAANRIAKRIRAIAATYRKAMETNS